MRKRALALALACATGGVWTAGTAIARPHGADTRRVAAERIEVPIKQTVLTRGVIRYSVPVKIGNANPIAAALDTGSTGCACCEQRFPNRPMRPATSRVSFGTPPATG